MVLLPACRCCSCNQPFATMGMPNSVEVSITGSSTSATMSGLINGSLPWSADYSFPDLSGTFSLTQSPFFNYQFEYLDDNIYLLFLQLGNTTLLSMQGRARLAFTESGSTTNTSGLVGGFIRKTCNTTTNVATYDMAAQYESFASSLEEILANSCNSGGSSSGWFGRLNVCLFLRAGSFAASLSSGCQIPASFSLGAGVVRYGPVGTTFAVGSSTFTDNSLTNTTYTGMHSNTSAFSLNSCQLVYGSEAIPFFGDIGQTSC